MPARGPASFFASKSLQRRHSAVPGSLDRQESVFPGTAKVRKTHRNDERRAGSVLPPIVACFSCSACSSCTDFFSATICLSPGNCFSKVARRAMHSLY